MVLLLSDALCEAGIIDEPFSAQMQRGRDRALYHLSTVNMERKNPVQRKALLKLKEEYDLDL